MPCQHEDTHTQKIKKQTLLTHPLTAESEMVTRPTSLTSKGASLSAYKAPSPSSSTKSRAFSSDRQRNAIYIGVRTFIKLMTIKTIYTRNLWILMLYSLFSLALALLLLLLPPIALPDDPEDGPLDSRLDTDWNQPSEESKTVPKP